MTACNDCWDEAFRRSQIGGGHQAEHYEAILLLPPAERPWCAFATTVTPPGLTDDGMGNTCSHTSATGVDTTSWTDPNKVWRCDHCGLRWVQGPDGTRVTPPAMPLSAPDSTPGAERPP